MYFISSKDAISITYKRKLFRRVTTRLAICKKGEWEFALINVRNPLGRGSCG